MKPRDFWSHVEHDPVFCRMIFLILGGYEQVALEDLAVGNLPAKRPPAQVPPKRPAVLGVSAEGLEGVEVRIGYCPARDRARLA